MDADRQRALDLLKATHQFPVDYHLSVITVHVEEVFLRVREAVEAGSGGPLADDAYQRVPSSGGKYASHRFLVRLGSPEEVLALYDRVQIIEGVVNLM